MVAVVQTGLLSGFAKRGALAPVESDELIDTQDVRTREEIDIVVAHIKRLVRSASLEFALRVGAVIIHHFYDGDTDAWRSRGPKMSSFRRLAAHPDLPLSPGSLYRCVALFELCERLKAPSRWEHLGTSHLRMVLGLPAAAQERILATANAKRWTVKVLQQEVLKEKSARLTCGGRRAEPPLTKSLRRVQKCLDEHRELIEHSSVVSTDELLQSRRLIEDARRHLDHLSECLACVTGQIGAFEGGASLHAK
jgi:hypothetical protein